MQHMNSVRGPATVIFTALLIIIMVSASRTSYMLSPDKRTEGIAVACVPPPAPVREAADRRACPWPHAMRRSGRWPKEAGVDAAAPSITPLAPADDNWTARKRQEDMPGNAPGNAPATHLTGE